MKNKNKGFTLIELIAVVIILSVIMLIGIIAVSKYLEDVHRSAFIDSVKSAINGFSKQVNSGDIKIEDPDITYYVPISCLSTENPVKSINGDFVKAYIATAVSDNAYEYYWTSVDNEGEGIRVITSYNDLTVDAIESGIDPEEVQPNLSIGIRTKAAVFNDTCTAIENTQDAHVVVKFSANGGTFSDGKNYREVTFMTSDLMNASSANIVKYSYTQNLNESGEKESDYGNYWGNSNIRGTDRGDTSKAHVVSIPGTPSLHVSLKYGGEIITYDWLCVWAGSHPNYTAEDCSTAIDGKIGPPDSNQGVLTKEFDVEGDTVTFSYRTDSSANGNSGGKGYGYHATISGEALSYGGSYEEPTREGYRFDGWEKDGQLYTSISSINPKENEVYKAKWTAVNKLIIDVNGGYYYLPGVSNSINTKETYIGEYGEQFTLGSIYKNSVTYSSGSYVVKYDSNGAPTTPSNQSVSRYYKYNCNYYSIGKSGGCGTYNITQSGGTYTYPSTAKRDCTLTLNWSCSSGSYYPCCSITLPKAPTYAGHRFLGWKTSSNVLYKSGDSFKPTAVQTSNPSETLTAQWETVDTSKLCVRASTLHKAKCEKSSGYYCNKKYSYNQEFTYGNLGTSGSLHYGDAFDCDVNGDGTYDTGSERFYYVGTEDGKASFLYSYAVSGGNIGTNSYAYHSAYANYSGPTVAYNQLPSTSQWSNSKIIAPGTRQIRNEAGGTTTSNGSYNLPNFTYTNKAARLLTAQELINVCNLSDITSNTSNTLYNCDFIFEGVNYYINSSGSGSLWLESAVSTNYYAVYAASAYNLNVDKFAASSSSSVKPVITVALENVEV